MLGGPLGYAILKAGWPNGPRTDPLKGSSGHDKLLRLFGLDVYRQIVGKVVLDFGCGEGAEAIEVAKHGAKQVIGLDTWKERLLAATEHAKAAGAEERCLFVPQWDDPVDVILSMDGFEHFADPAGVLRTMHSLLKPSGRVLACFGPTWYHPLGGHLFSIFPWAHLLFSEEVLCQWRRNFKSDGATRFCEVAGGLNQMTIGRFVRLVKQSPLQFESFEARPIRKLRRLANRLTREFTTAVVRCTLIPR